MRIALGIEYDGHGFLGWQSQKNLPTVQACLEEALSKIADEEIKVFCAGRTDAGVHAIGQVIHFDTKARRDLRAWTLGTNSYLPSSIAVTWVTEVDETFHARFSALSRRYHYVIYNTSIRPALLAKRVTWYQRCLNVEKMEEAGQFLLGELDFSSFRSLECESKTPRRNVHFIKVNRYGDFVVIDIQANAFLHHMVRNIAGVLMQVGAGRKEPHWVKEVLEAKDRRKAAETAPAAGLYLYQVNYPDNFSLTFVLSKRTMCNEAFFKSR
ncbi:MAG TPA: tRNA pseudouridine(38-40) synthase TruA [Gammaproteobacteria bacterium]|nr:tRNA pseudouridine(38-40) synthase TruA [Gammaproteobacteria bacterium]